MFLFFLVKYHLQGYSPQNLVFLRNGDTLQDENTDRQRFDAWKVSFWNQSSDGSRGGGTRDVHPLSVQFFSIFMQFSAKIMPNNR